MVLTAEVFFFLNFIAGVWQGDAFATCPLHLDYVLQNSVNKIKENGFTHRQAKTRRYQAKTIPSADYVNNLALFTNDLAVFADDPALFVR